ncbi:Thioredoxin-like protein [Glarea lozoyensis ATCC 20868]|uniref:Thioredoxin-like protein n=1 Tax=Glarea lozoyensis (strain ATCC 20868 / MF5171) TaxID=1116229 RepID=S3DYW8_GLAL2|nr:Thioredoxin-like protein [Glarea lozoyensis ATCC 20868]EPE31548.1 Thioredoxin-like protein [Glarea lozoyensis ATCC 20868]
MPSARRMRVFGLLVLCFTVTVLYYTASARSSRPRDLRTAGDFYSKTVNALPKDVKGGAQKVVDEDDEEVKARTARLRDAAKLAKDKANKKAPKPDAPGDIEGVGSASEGRGVVGSAGRRKEKVEGVKESEEDHDVEVELNSILKRAPIIIFSKSYCPHSMRAKRILLEKYEITPAPYVVELDKHELGLGLQARLADLTGRRTVPNVLVNGVSIGGGDDVADLDEKKALSGKLKEIMGKKTIEVKLKAAEEATEGGEKKGSEVPNHGL